MFALAASAFDEMSQTFVRAHAEGLAPGRTLFVTSARTPPATVTGPALYDINRLPRLADGAGATDRAPGLPLPPLNTGVIAAALKRHGVAAMMTEFGRFGVRMAPVARRAGCRHYVHFHGHDATAAARSRLVAGLYRSVLFPGAEAVFTPSAYIADRLIALGCPAAKLHVTPGGVRPENFPPSAREPGRMIAVGRFVEKKAPHLTLRAFARAAATHPDAHLDFVGDGPLLARCEADARAAGVADRVTFHGARDHAFVRDLMGRASILLQHSVTSSSGDTEGLPVAVLEAMCAGLCVIATRHSGIPEAVLEGETGMLVDEFDVEGMGRCIDAALSDPDSVAGMGDRARRRVLDRFTTEHSLARQREVMGLG